MAKKKQDTTEPIEITPEDSVVPIYLVPLTLEEEAQKELRGQEQADRELSEIAKEEAKASARAKLAILGLTEEEVLALLG